MFLVRKNFNEKSELKHMSDSWHRQNWKEKSEIPPVKTSGEKNRTLLICHPRLFDFGIKSYIFISMFSDPQYALLYLSINKNLKKLQTTVYTFLQYRHMYEREREKAEL